MNLAFLTFSLMPFLDAVHPESLHLPGQPFFLSLPYVHEGANIRLTQPEKT